MATDNQYVIQYNPEFLSLLKDLCKISQSFTMKKIHDGKSIDIVTTNSARTISYHLQAPADLFNFDGEKISFADFTSFYSFYSSGVFKNKEVIFTQKNQDIIISTDDSRFRYHLVDERATPRVPVLPLFDKANAKFEISKESLEVLRTNGGLVNAEEILFTVLHDRVKTCQFHARYGHKFERVFLQETGVPADSPVKLNIFNQIIICIPQMFNYNVKISNGNIQFSPDVNTLEDISLNIYTSEKESEDE